ncbi:MAG: hypothetical protein K9W42_04660 [Candidatus Heimdallarchaeota archaeon]|nr:hypothetical protein [Candidatus Heimdallarchaeota archaeon]
MKEDVLLGTISYEQNEYFLTTKKGKKYKLYAIEPWESVPPDFDSGKFAPYVGKKVRVFGRVMDGEIWNAMVQLPDQKDTIPPKLDDLLTKQEKKK